MFVQMSSKTQHGHVEIMVKLKRIVLIPLGTLQKAFQTLD